MALRLQTFGGIRPLVSARLLGDTEATVASNLDLTAGTIRPLRDPVISASLEIDGAKTIFRHNGEWLAWATDVDVVRGPLADDQYARIYYTGDGVPKVRGTLNNAKLTYNLGVPAPESPPGLTVQNALTTAWTRQWYGFWEEPDGTKMEENAIADGSVTEVSPGVEYTTTIPSRGSASLSAKFVMYFDAYRSGGAVLMGRVYPTFSDYAGNSDLYISGAKVTAKQTNSGGVGGTATLRLDYDTSEASNYTVSRSWVYTLVSAFGEEGPPSDPSEVVDVTPAQAAVLGAMITESPAGYNITKKRIYRTVTGDAGTEYQFIGEIDIDEDEFVDGVLDEDAAETLPSTTWTPPPSDLAGLVAMPGEFLAGFSGKTVWFSEPGYPHAWPVGYGITVEDNIVGLAVSGTTLVVLTDRSPFLISAQDPANTAVVKIPTVQACVAKRSIVEWGGAVFYSGTDGLIRVADGTAVVVTANHYDKAQWTALGSSTMFAEVFDDQLYVFHANGGLIFTFGGGQVVLTTHDIEATAAYHDPEDDELAIVQGLSICTFDGGTSLSARWRTREIALGRPQDFGVVRVVADGYPVTFRAYADGSAVAAFSITNDQARRMPRCRPSKFWMFEVETTETVREILVSHSMGDLT